MDGIIGKILEPNTTVKDNIKEGHGPEAFIIINWNMQTKKMFDKGNKPKQGGKYVLKCLRFDGARAYFGLEQL